MILVFIFLFLMILSALIVLILAMSSIKIKFKNINVINLKLNDNYKIFFEIYFLNKIKIFSIKINKERIKNISFKERINKISKSNIKFEENTLKEIFKIKPRIEKLYLKANIGYEDASILPNIIAIIDSSLSIILSLFSDKKKNIRYIITPKFNTNTIDIFFESIISIKIVHIIYVILILVKKGSKKNERTSNRRSYAVQP